MNATDLIIVGLQSGDEGKGKFTDIFARDADFVVRFQGGPHTGHTVAHQGVRYRFVQLPAGLLRGSFGLLGNGCVIEPDGLLAEIAALEESGWAMRLGISPLAHVIFPYHRAQDAAMESWRGTRLALPGAAEMRLGLGQLGSTRTGVGPCREDKIARIGLRIADLFDFRALKQRIERLVALKRRLLEETFKFSLSELEGYRPEDWDPPRLAQRYHRAGLKLAPYIEDVSATLHKARRDGCRILHEGAQSFALDVEHGTYPFCSSGYSAASGATVGTGTSPAEAFEVYGVIKAYSSTVGGGFLPTELEGSAGDYLVERGNEYGTVTGRRRRVGWLDLAFIRRAITADRPSHLCIASLDVLAGLPEVKIATGYRRNGRHIDSFPVSAREALELEPIYTALEGWPDIDWRKAARSGVDALPRSARAYLDFIAKEAGIPLAAVGVGPERNDTLIFSRPWPRPSREHFAKIAL